MSRENWNILQIFQKLKIQIMEIDNKNLEYRYNIKNI